MAERYEFEYTLTREDWLRVSAAAIEASDLYEQHARAYRRQAMRMMLWQGPLIVLGGAFFIGGRGSTQGMYLEGSLGGLVLAGLMTLYYAQPRVKQMKQAALNQVQRTEWGDHIGPIRMTLGPEGVRYCTRSDEIAAPLEIYRTVKPRRVLPDWFQWWARHVPASSNCR